MRKRSYNLLITVGANGVAHVPDKTAETATFGIPASLLPVVTYERAG